MNKKIGYESFDNYILRTPLFSFSAYKEFTSKKTISDHDFKTLCKDEIFKEALFLASPHVHRTAEKWLNNDLKDKKKIEKLRTTLLKYYSRMSSRCTPFGLFASCSVGSIGKQTKIELNSASKNKRRTRLDMNFLFSFAKNLSEVKQVKEQLLFFPNTSIYELGNKLRYVEYTYQNNKRYHHIASVDYSIYLESILKAAKKGALVKNLARTIVDEDITIDDAKEFIEELIENQLLVSELEPSISGEECFDQILKVLNRLDETESFEEILRDVKEQIKSIDKNIGNNADCYAAIKERLKSLNIEFDESVMFQTDMMTDTADNTIDEKLISDLKKGITFLNKIALPSKESLLTKFKDEYYERYENKEMPLSKALDTEAGVGYKQGNNANDINPLVDAIFIQEQDTKHTEKKVKWTTLNSIFQKKLIQAYKDNAYCITVDDEDVKDYEANWNDLPDTISFEVEIVIIDGKEKVKLNGGGLSSAANLMGRFCYGDKNIHDLVNAITEVEQKINKDKIVAEILHLPESRVGNIIMRPDFRTYEIPYLTRSLKPEDKQLLLEDLTIAVKNNTKIKLRSKKHNKEVIPRLTNAHNYKYNALPVYQFLCDLQTQNRRDKFFFSFGPLASEYEFLPRVEYQNLILHSATWNLNQEHIKDIVLYKNNDDKLMTEVRLLRARLKMPQYVLLIEGDNHLVVNLENSASVKMLLAEVEKRSHFKLTEFLFSENGSVKYNKAYYTNQIIMPFYNREKLNRN